MANLAATTAAATFREGVFAAMPAALQPGCTFHCTDTGDFWIGTAGGNVKRPAPHAVNHAAGGSDPLTPPMIGAVAATDARLSNARAPLVHASTHATGGSDALTPSAIGALSATDTSVTNARTPTSHKASHATGGTDALAPSDIGAVASSDARLTNARTPTAHAATHATAGADPITPQSIGAVPTTAVPVSRTGAATLPALAINAVVTITITWMMNGVATPFADLNYTYTLPMIVTAAGLVLSLSPTSFTKYVDKLTFTVTSLSALTAGAGVASSIATHN